jgi:hypothetical protein
MSEQDEDLEAWKRWNTKPGAQPMSEQARTVAEHIVNRYCADLSDEITVALDAYAAEIWEAAAREVEKELGGLTLNVNGNLILKGRRLVERLRAHAKPAESPSVD